MIIREIYAFLYLKNNKCSNISEYESRIPALSRVQTSQLNKCNAILRLNASVNPLKGKCVRWLPFEVFSAIQV